MVEKLEGCKYDNRGGARFLVFVAVFWRLYEVTVRLLPKCNAIQCL